MVVALAGVTWLAEASSPAVARTAAIAMACSLAGCALRVMFMGLPCLPRYGSVEGTPSGRSGEAADEGERGLRDLGDSGVIGAVWVHRRLRSPGVGPS